MFEKMLKAKDKELQHQRTLSAELLAQSKLLQRKLGDAYHESSSSPVRSLTTACDAGEEYEGVGARRGVLGGGHGLGTEGVGLSNYRGVERCVYVCGVCWWMDGWVNVGGCGDGWVGGWVGGFCVSVRVARRPWLARTCQHTQCVLSLYISLSASPSPVLSLSLSLSLSLTHTHTHTRTRTRKAEDGKEAIAGGGQRSLVGRSPDSAFIKCVSLYICLWL